ncbi:hypothetical protein GLYMA_01G062251v4 [Glycine max]|nr:hypothetical protein GLYMA_01G062251v4 [Glycine max]KAH1161860.1 hypothetical protein GYH30_000648 [Glycine max]
MVRWLLRLMAWWVRRLSYPSPSTVDFDLAFRDFYFSDD